MNNKLTAFVDPGMYASKHFLNSVTTRYPNVDIDIKSIVDDGVSAQIAGVHEVPALVSVSNNKVTVIVEGDFL